MDINIFLTPNLTGCINMGCSLQPEVPNRINVLDNSINLIDPTGLCIARGYWDALLINLNLVDNDYMVDAYNRGDMDAAIRFATKFEKGAYLVLDVAAIPAGPAKYLVTVPAHALRAGIHGYEQGGAKQGGIDFLESAVIGASSAGMTLAGSEAGKLAAKGIGSGWPVLEKTVLVGTDVFFRGVGKGEKVYTKMQKDEYDLETAAVDTVDFTYGILKDLGYFH